MNASDISPDVRNGVEKLLVVGDEDLVSPRREPDCRPWCSRPRAAR